MFGGNFPVRAVSLTQGGGYCCLIQRLSDASFSTARQTHPDSRLFTCGCYSHVARRHCSLSLAKCLTMTKKQTKQWRIVLRERANTFACLPTRRNSAGGWFDLQSTKRCCLSAAKKQRLCQRLLSKMNRTNRCFMCIRKPTCSHISDQS